MLFLLSVGLNYHKGGRDVCLYLEQSQKNNTTVYIPASEQVFAWGDSLCSG